MRPEHIEKYLVTVRTGPWFGWTDSSNKIYANLIVHDGGSKPTEKECTDGLAALQAKWDEENKEYRVQRRIGVGDTSGYPNIRTQLDQLWHDIDSGKLGDTAKTGTWYLAVKKVKDYFPKP